MLLKSENPEIASDVLTSGHRTILKKLNKKYQGQPIEETSCVIVNDRVEANHWIELRHTGENEGAEIVAWGGAETARFRARSGHKEIHLQVLDFLEKAGELTKDKRQKVPVTSLKRLLGDKYVQNKLGMNISNGDIGTRFESSEIVKGLSKVVDDLATGKITTRHIYTKDDRTDYINNFQPVELPDTTKPMSDFRKLSDLPITTQTTSKKKSPPTTRITPTGKQRPNLIPRGLRLSIPQGRINDIYYELRHLKIEDFTNSVAVMLRVFIELSVDKYIDDQKLPFDVNWSLSKKLNSVAEYLKNQGKLNDQQVKPISRATQKDSFLSGTVLTIHQYVHNPYFSPAPSDLRAAWDSFQPFIEALWYRP